MGELTNKCEFKRAAAVSISTFEKKTAALPLNVKVDFICTRNGASTENRSENDVFTIGDWAVSYSLFPWMVGGH